MPLSDLDLLVFLHLDLCIWSQVVGWKF
jgi:hypothetical protein